MEESSGVIPTYRVLHVPWQRAALDAASGKQIWKTYTIPEEPQQTTKAARGMQLWGLPAPGCGRAPALDAERNRLYVATGDATRSPAAPRRRDHGARDGHREDRLGSPDAGRRRLERRVPRADRRRASRTARPRRGPTTTSALPPRSSPPDGRRLLIAGQKSGELYVVNADSGEMVWKTRAGDGGVLGGIEWGFATDGTSAFVSLSSAFEKKPGEAGGLVSVNLADGKPRWTAPPSADTCAGRAGCNTGQPAAVSAMPGVDLLRRARWPSARLRLVDRQGDLGRGHRARLRHHGERRAGARAAA